MNHKTMNPHITSTPSAPRHSLADRIHYTLSPLALALLTLAGTATADDANPHHRSTPDLPTPACDSLEVPVGNRVSSRLYALGVQIYRWTGSSWVFVAPEAGLYADAGYNGQVGIHYGGPTWEANDGSTVVAARQADCTPFPGTIPWLRLGATSTSERGRFAGVTYIQRVNTIGGTAPATAGAFVGEEARVPYSAEYYFYRAANN